MAFRKFVRESAFQLARRDVAFFLRDHEADILAIFREEMQQLDDDMPEERLFIDIKMVPLGEAIVKAALQAITRFLLDDVPVHNEEKPSPLPAREDSESRNVTFKDSVL